MIGCTAYGSDGGKLGKVRQVFLDDDTGRPELVRVRTGLLGTGEALVPVGEATLDADRLLVPYPKRQVRGAPRVAVYDGHLEKAQERRLYAHYGLAQDPPSAPGAVEAPPPPASE